MKETAEDRGDRTVAEVILAGVIELAKTPSRANQWAVQMVVDRLLPKVQAREHSGHEGTPLTFAELVRAARDHRQRHDPT